MITKTKKLIIAGIGLLVVFTILTLIIKTAYKNKQECGDIFISCHYSWHYETNKLGQKVSVHVLVDSKGNKLGAQGFEYTEGVEGYNKMLLSIPGVKIANDTEKETIYAFPSGGTATLTKTAKPILSREHISFEDSELIDNTMFSVPSYKSTIKGSF